MTWRTLGSCLLLCKVSHTLCAKDPDLCSCDSRLTEQVMGNSLKCLHSTVSRNIAGSSSGCCALEKKHDGELSAMSCDLCICWKLENQATVTRERVGRKIPPCMAPIGYLCMAALHI